MRKSVKIKFSDEAKQIYNKLREKASSSKIDRMLLSAIDRKVEIIRSYCFYGDTIPHRLIPKIYKKRYCVTNLLRVELPCFWRLLYTIRKDEVEIEIIAFIIEILDHNKYNKRFGYKKH
jgi:hypothetical protein